MNPLRPTFVGVSGGVSTAQRITIIDNPPLVWHSAMKRFFRDHWGAVCDGVAGAGLSAAKEAPVFRSCLAPTPTTPFFTLREHVSDLGFCCFDRLGQFVRLLATGLCHVRLATTAAAHDRGNFFDPVARADATFDQVSADPGD